MKFETIIIGGGIAALNAGLRLAEAGVHTLILSSGQSALHFSSGSIDLLNGLGDPKQNLAEFIANNPNHPYAKAGAEAVWQSLRDFTRHTAAGGLTYQHQEQNHYRVTPLGTLKQSWLSPKSSATYAVGEAPKHLLLATVAGFRDFQPQLAADNLAKDPRFANTKIETIELPLPQLATFGNNPFELRSADIARLCDRNQLLKQIGQGLLAASKGQVCDVILPAFLTMGLVETEIHALEVISGCRVREVATMPPSLIGMRLHEVLKRRFVQLGGTFLTSERVVGAKFDGNRVAGIYSQNGDDILFRADNYLLATGSFFSRGLESTLRTMREPIFDVDMFTNPDRDQWAAQKLFAPHPFLSFGVESSANFNLLREGKVIENLYGIGSILAHSNPISEGSGSGVAISSGWAVANQILQARNNQIQPEVSHAC